jgi:WD40 repeat protein
VFFRPRRRHLIAVYTNSTLSTKYLFEMYLVPYNRGISIWNGDNGELINSTSTDKGAVSKVEHVDVSPDNSLLATVSKKSKTIELWDLPALTSCRSIDDSSVNTYFGKIEFCSDSTLLVRFKLLYDEDEDEDDENGDDTEADNGDVSIQDGDKANCLGGLKIWNVTSSACISSWDYSGLIDAIRFGGPNSQVAFMVAEPHVLLELRVWDRVTGVVDTIAAYPGYLAYLDINFTADICTIVSGFDFRRPRQLALRLELREWSQKKVRWDTALSGSLFFSGFSSTINANGDIVAVVTGRHRITIFASQDGSILTELHPTWKTIESVCCHPTDPGVIAVHFAGGDKVSSRPRISVYNWMNCGGEYHILSSTCQFKFSRQCQVLL